MSAPGVSSLCIVVMAVSPSPVLRTHRTPRSGFEVECYLNGPVVGKTGGGYYLNTVSRVNRGQLAHQRCPAARLYSQPRVVRLPYHSRTTIGVPCPALSSRLPPAPVDSGSFGDRSYPLPRIEP